MANKIVLDDNVTSSPIVHWSRDVRRKQSKVFYELFVKLFINLWRSKGPRILEVLLKIEISLYMGWRRICLLILPLS